MIKFGDNINFDNILEEVEAERQVKYSCPCSYETCKKYKLNDEFIDFIMYGDKNTRPQKGQEIDWENQDGILYPDVEYRQEIFKHRFNKQLAFFESRILMILDRKRDDNPVDFDQLWSDATTKPPNPDAVMFEQQLDGLLHISQEYFYVDANIHRWMREQLSEQGVQFYNPQIANFKGVKLLPGQNKNDIAAKTANFIHELYFHPSLDDKTKSEMGFDAGCLDLSEWDKLVKYIVDQLEGAPDKNLHTIMVTTSKRISFLKFAPYIESGKLVSADYSPPASPTVPPPVPTQATLEF